MTQLGVNETQKTSLPCILYCKGASCRLQRRKIAQRSFGSMPSYRCANRDVNRRFSLQLWWCTRNVPFSSVKTKQVSQLVLVFISLEKCIACQLSNLSPAFSSSFLSFVPCVPSFVVLVIIVVVLLGSFAYFILGSLGADFGALVR